MNSKNFQKAVVSWLGAVFCLMSVEVAPLDANHFALALTALLMSWITCGLGVFFFLSAMKHTWSVLEIEK